jgi:hypothetical protein
MHLRATLDACTAAGLGVRFRTQRRHGRAIVLGRCVRAP